MSLLTKECEVCGTKIRKLQSIWNIYLLKTGVNIKCPNCNLKYKRGIIYPLLLVYRKFFLPSIQFELEFGQLFGLTFLSTHIYSVR